ncbi:MAG: carboxypeptidase regulatory-like domain-containing protein [Acidobacteria bacterium]|nr:carboxypeptidase regulatory-like domain-containing protein [Acidobacteriota bacterium]
MKKIRRFGVTFVFFAVIAGALTAASSGGAQGFRRTAAGRDPDSLPPAGTVDPAPVKPPAADSFASVTVFAENFDGVGAPALPAGWTTQRTGGAPPPFFATSTSAADTAPNAVFTNGSLNSSNSLLSPAIALPAGMSGFRLSFAQTRNFEVIGPICFDAGILELSTDGGTTFNNVTSPAVGGSFTAGAYNSTVSAGSNPISPSQAWCGSQSTFALSTLSLPGSLSGQTAIFRWRAGWDNSGIAANPNWVIDSVVLTATIDLTVNSTADPGDGVCNPAECTLREAINTAASGDTIPFAAALFSTPQTITLTAGELPINKDLTIAGPGANRLSISGNNASRVFNIGAGFTANISGVTITGGRSNSGGGGGGVINNGNLNLSGSVVTGNTAAGAGGGVFCQGTGSMSIAGSTISGNSTTGLFNGGGFQNNCQGTTTITNSTISGNTASNIGGGFRTTQGDVTVTNSTITNNTALNGAGGISIGTGSITVRNTIVAGNQNNATIPDVAGAFISGGFNLIGNVSGATGFNQTGDQTGTGGAPLDPLLGPLGNNGGPTPTHAISTNSPALDKGSSFGATTDQRGLVRPRDNPAVPNAGDGADIGAYEAQVATAAALTIAGRVTTADGRGLANATVYLTKPDGSYLTVRTGTFGNYSFEGIEAGSTVVVTVVSKRFTFAPQVVSVSENIKNLDFTAL